MKKFLLFFAAFVMSVVGAMAEDYGTFSTSPAPVDGDFVSGTKFYTIKVQRDGYLATDRVSNGYLTMHSSMKPTNDAGKWAFVQTESGLQLYNKATGAEQVLTFASADNSAHCSMGSDLTATTSFFECVTTQNTQFLAGYECFKIKDTEAYLNHSNNSPYYLNVWTSDQALWGWEKSAADPGNGDAGSQFLIELAEELIATTYTINVEGAPGDVTVTINGVQKPVGEAFELNSSITAAAVDVTKFDFYDYNVDITDGVITITYTAWPDYYYNRSLVGVAHTRSERTITSVKLGEQEETINGNGNIYQDLTSSITFKINVGEQVKPAIIWSGAWMHGYVFVDTDSSDKQFTTSELVSAAGKPSPEANVELNTAMPAFQIDEPGTYRMRYMVAWDSTDPAGPNTIVADGGYILDFLLEVIDPNAPTTVDVTYNVTFNGNTLTTKTITETVGAAPTFDVTELNAPAYVTVAELPATIDAETTTVTVETTLNEQAPFEFEKEYIVYFRNGSNYYFWNNDEGVANEVRLNGQNAELTSKDQLSEKYDNFRWTMGGDWMNGFTFTNNEGKMLQVPALTNGSACSMVDSDATHFDMKKQDNGFYRFYIHDNETFYLAHTSHNSHRVTIWNDPTYGLSTVAGEGGASVVQFEEYVAPAPIVEVSTSTVTITFVTSTGAKYMLNNNEGSLNVIEYAEEAPETAQFEATLWSNDKYTYKNGELFLGYNRLDTEFASNLNYWTLATLEGVEGDYITQTVPEGTVYLRVENRAAGNAQAGVLILKEADQSLNNSGAPFFNGEYTSALLVEEVVEPAVYEGVVTPSITSFATLDDLQGIKLTFEGAKSVVAVDEEEMGGIYFGDEEGTATYAIWHPEYGGAYTIEGNVVTLTGITAYEGFAEAGATVTVEDYGTFVADDYDDYFTSFTLTYTAAGSSEPFALVVSNNGVEGSAAGPVEASAKGLSATFNIANEGLTVANPEGVQFGRYMGSALEGATITVNNNSIVINGVGEFITEPGAYMLMIMPGTFEDAEGNTNEQYAAVWSVIEKDPTPTFPVEGVAYKVKEVNGGNYVTIISDDTQAVALNSAAQEIYFEATTDGWYIKNAAGLYMCNQAKAWNISSAGDKIVWTVEAVDGGNYALKNSEGYLGFNSTTEGVKGFRNKGIGENAVFEITEFAARELTPAEKLLALVEEANKLIENAPAGVPEGLVDYLSVYAEAGEGVATDETSTADDIEYYTVMVQRYINRVTNFDAAKTPAEWLTEVQAVMEDAKKIIDLNKTDYEYDAELEDLVIKETLAGKVGYKPYDELYYMIFDYDDIDYYIEYTEGNADVIEEELNEYGYGLWYYLFFLEDDLYAYNRAECVLPEEGKTYVIRTAPDRYSYYLTTDESVSSLSSKEWSASYEADGYSAWTCLGASAYNKVNDELEIEYVEDRIQFASLADPTKFLAWKSIATKQNAQNAFWHISGKDAPLYGALSMQAYDGANHFKYLTIQVANDGAGSLNHGDGWNWVENSQYSSWYVFDEIDPATTGFGTVLAPETISGKQIYNLQGQLQNRVRHGISIQGGKKIFNK